MVHDSLVCLGVGHGAILKHLQQQQQQPLFVLLNVKIVFHLK